jgi:thymidine kinase
MSLELVIGPMFSGKSTKLIRKIQLAKSINKKVLVIKPLIETRYGENKLSSHSLEYELCQSSSTLETFSNDVLNYDVIVIDEGQFFPDLKQYVLLWVDKFGKDVIVGGLDGDSEKHPFGQILQLIPYSDKCKKLSALCKDCNDGTLAIFTRRNIKYDHQIKVGGIESYSAVCRKHYNTKI